MRHLVISKSITQRDYKSLDKYFNEIDKIALISPQEEAVLAKMIREGDKQALERLTKTNLRFVISVAKQYLNQGLTLGDLINEGNIGLIIAARRYDETKGFKFISYAVWWILQSIITAIAEHARMVRLPYNQLTLSRKLYKALARLEQHHSRKPCIEEIAEHLGISVSKVSELLSRIGEHISIDEPFRPDEEYTLLDVMHNSELHADGALIHESVKKEIRHSLEILSKRDRELLTMYFGLDSFSPLSLEEIAKRFNITKEHAGRLKERALGKLRNSSNAPVLRSCLS